MRQRTGPLPIPVRHWLQRSLIMPPWMVRAGSNSEREQLALDNNLVVVGWKEVPDLASTTTREAVRDILRASFPDSSESAITNWTG